MLNNVPAAMDVMKKMYCRHNYKDCARYKIAIELGPDKIPDDLFPKDIARALVLLTQDNWTS